MKILITGINGLAGSFIAKQMLEAGHEVFGLVRDNSDLSLLSKIESKITFEKGDILDVLNLENAIIGKDWVIHCAGLVSFSSKDRDKLFKINTEGTANVVNICLANNIKKLAFISSVAALGRHIKDQNAKFQTISETQEWLDSPDNSNYAKSKYLAELEVWRGISEGLSAVIVNPSNILAEADWHKSSTRLFKYVFDEHLFYTDGNLNYVDAEDLAIIVDKLLSSNIGNERFIVSAGALPQIEMFGKMAQYFLKKPPKYKIGSFLISILWRFEAIKSFLLGNEPLITKETATTAKRQILYDNSKIKKAFNFDFQPIDKTLARACKALIAKA
jgi:dihydroflavonol-4-reductase